MNKWSYSRMHRFHYSTSLVIKSSDALEKDLKSRKYDLILLPVWEYLGLKDDERWYKIFMSKNKNSVLIYAHNVDGFLECFSNAKAMSLIRQVSKEIDDRLVDGDIYRTIVGRVIPELNVELVKQKRKPFRMEISDFDV